MSVILVTFEQSAPSPYSSPQGSAAHSANSWSEHLVSLTRLREGDGLCEVTQQWDYPDPTPYPEPSSLTSLDPPGPCVSRVQRTIGHGVPAVS